MKKNTGKTNEPAEMEINLIPLLKELLKCLWLIALIGVVIGGAAFAAARIFVKPTYRCGFTAYINNKQVQQNTDYLTVSDVSASKQIVLTYQTTLASSSVLSAAAESIRLDLPYSSLRPMVSIEAQDETQIITVYVVSTDPKQAYDFAEAIAKTAPDHMADIVEGSSMKIIDHPVYTETRYKPNYFRYALIGFIIGALIVAAGVIILYFLDDTVKSETDMEARFSLPILGVIPDVSRAGAKGSDYYDYYSYGQSGEKQDDSKGEEQSNEKE